MSAAREEIRCEAGRTSRAALSLRENRNRTTEVIQDKDLVPLLSVRLDISTPQNLWLGYSRKGWRCHYDVWCTAYRYHHVKTQKLPNYNPEIVKK